MNIQILNVFEIFKYLQHNAMFVKNRPNIEIKDSFSPFIDFRCSLNQRS